MTMNQVSITTILSYQQVCKKQYRKVLVFKSGELDLNPDFFQAVVLLSLVYYLSKIPNLYYSLIYRSLETN